MEVIVTTFNNGEYIFTKEPDGHWELLWHHRSYYIPCDIVEIKFFQPMIFTAKKYYPLTKEFGEFFYCKSSRVKKIIVDGKKVNSFLID